VDSDSLFGNSFGARGLGFGVRSSWFGAAFKLAASLLKGI
jgi:hypothetical protein